MKRVTINLHRIYVYDTIYILYVGMISTCSGGEQSSAVWPMSQNESVVKSKN